MPEFVLSGVTSIVSLAEVSVLFALIFKYIPETNIAGKSLWTGAIGTAFPFTVGKFLIGLYLGNAAVGSAYVADKSLIVIIVWVYYSSTIFFFGADFTHILARRQQSPMIKTEDDPLTPSKLNSFAHNLARP